MASRQRPSSSRSNAPAVSGDQLSGTPGSSEASKRGQDSAILRASFDTKPFEDSTRSTLDAASIPKVSFAGEQIIHKDREARIAELAYSRAEQRSFDPGHELDDWLWAEREVDGSMSSRFADRDAR